LASPIEALPATIPITGANAALASALSVCH
jgi:hypothetical protein